MTTPNGKHEFEAAFELIENEITALMDVRIGWGVLPREDVGEYYQLDREALRVIKVALRDYEKVKAEGKSLEEALGIAAKAYATLKARAEKAEAKLATTNKAWDIKQKQLETARAEVEKVKDNLAWMVRNRDHLLGQLEKVKAERDKLRARIGNAILAENEWLACVESHTKLEVELARWKPLIEAARGVDKVGVLSYYDDTMRLVYGNRPIPEDNWDYVIHALLAALPERDK